jgi:type II secretory pathway component PulF
MPKFLYKAKDGPEKTIDGELIAESRETALAVIEEMGYTPITVKEKGLDEDSLGRLPFRRISTRDINVFTRQLAGLLKSGVPILRALRTVGEQSENVRFRRVVGEIEATVRDGAMLSAALAKHPRLFTELYVNMVRSGESAGVLDTILLRLADAREKEEDVRRKVSAALAYPSLVLVVGFVTVFVMLTFFLPRISDMFRSFSDLPMPTKILIGISDFCSKYWKAGLLPLILLIAILKRITSGGAGRGMVDSFKLRLPLAGKLIREAEVARFARTLSLLVEAGIPVERGLALSAATMNNSVLREEIDKVRRRTIEQGASIANGLRDASNFPSFARNMIAVGEESGRIDESLADVASFYEKEVDHSIALATSLIEPVLILLVGGVVGFIVFAMLLPIFAVTQSVG